MTCSMCYRTSRLVGWMAEVLRQVAGTHLGICELVKLITLESQSALSLAECLSDLICALQIVNLVSVISTCSVNMSQ